MEAAAASGGSGDWRRTKKKQSRKNQIRSVERSLRREGLSADAKASLTAKLRELQSAVVQKEQQDVERKRATRYHKVKFFERQKVNRKLESARKKLDAIGRVKAGGASSSGSSKKRRTGQKHEATDDDSVRKEIAALEDDLTYIQYFPKDKKYLSLFSSRESEDERTTERKAQMRVLARAARKAEEEEARLAMEAKAARKRERHEKKMAAKAPAPAKASLVSDEDEDEDEHGEKGNDHNSGSADAKGKGKKRKSAGTNDDGHRRKKEAAVLHEDEEEDGAGFFVPE